MAIETLMSLARAAGHEPLPLPQRRWLGDAGTSAATLRAWMGDGVPTDSGVSVTQHSALRLGPVYACINIISEDLGTCPLQVFENMPDGGRRRAREHYAYPMLHDEPNPEMPATALWQTLTGHVLGWGNCYAQLDWNGAGRLRGIWPLPPDRVQVDRNRANRLVYVCQRTGQSPLTLQADEVLHIAGLGFDGLIGYSPIHMAREAIALGLAPETYAAKFYANNATPGVTLHSPGRLNQDTRERLKASWNDIHAGLQGAHKTAVLEEGLDIKIHAIPQKDAQFIESRTFQIQEICRLYRMPPHMVAEMSHATFSNIEHQDLAYTKRTVRPWAKRFEAEINRKLFGRGSAYFAEFNLEALLRGDLKSRMESYEIATRSGLLQINEARAKENLPAVAGGDRNLVQMQMVPLEQAGQQNEKQN